ncbi:hypothetical protein [Saprospira grandis]|uniref:hypothetical protein n=1 Tax=Saprospira grandis TaxID=1008 RepID=UPI0011D24D41|nr:hypothetical protein [Saprospira grandis]
MNVLVTAISGNLGFGVLNTIKSISSEVVLFGVDAINPYLGKHLCEKCLCSLPKKATISYRK